MLLLLINQAAAAPLAYVNASAVVSSLWRPLNAAGAGDAIFWTETEMYQWIDEAAKTLARKCGVFTTYDETVVAVLNQGAYTLPARHVSTIQVDLARLKVLGPSSVQQFEARDDAWPTTSGEPDSWAQNNAGVVSMLLYPRPDAGAATKTIGIVEHVYPADITPTAGIVAAPVVFQDYFRFYALGEARAKETKAQMQETAQWFRGVAGMFEMVAANYWGASR